MEETAALTVIEKPNYFALLVGPPSHGKSSLAAELAEERLAAGRWLLVQDVNAEFGRFCTRYATAADYLRASADAAASGQPLGRGAALACQNGADELLELAKVLGQRFNQEHGAVRVPFCVVVNEAGAFVESGYTHIGKLQEYVLNQRRHLGLELIYCMQRASQLPRPVWETVTDAWLFAQYNDQVITELEQRLALERGALALLQELPAHRAVHWRPQIRELGGRVRGGLCTPGNACERCGGGR